MQRARELMRELRKGKRTRQNKKGKKGKLRIQGNQTREQENEET